MLEKDADAIIERAPLDAHRPAADRAGGRGFGLTRPDMATPKVRVLGVRASMPGSSRNGWPLGIRGNEHPTFGVVLL